MLIQIYTFQTIEEALKAVELGVHHLGLTPSQIGLPGEITWEKAAEIAHAVPKTVKTSALSVSENMQEIIEMANLVKADVLHLCGEIYSIKPDEVSELRKHIPTDMQIMQAIPVGQSREAIKIAQDYAECADILLLDSYTTTVDGIGASGETHDWNISREIVQSVNKPVILAGGLSHENVAEAIKAVRPAGVDSLTHTNKPLGDGKFRKDMDKIKSFVENALSALDE